MNSALVIGLGTSGLHIIEECQQFHYQFKSQKNRPDHVKYLFLETDINKTPGTTALGTSDIEAVPIPLTNIVSGITSLREKNNIDKSWIPDADSALAAGTGAGGNSAYGRLALWINYGDVQQKITDAWKDILGNNQTYIYVVGTLTGGTGSGTCVDVAYMVREITGSDNVFGLFLTPSRQQLEGGGQNSLLYNYYSAITAIHHYSREDTVYDIVKPSGTNIKNPARPFKQCYFLSQDYTSGFAPMDLYELYKVAGLHVFTRINGLGEVDGGGNDLPNMSKKLDERAIDMQMNVSSWMFSTFGSKMIYYPKTLIKELFGLQLASAQLARWVDSSNCLVDNNTVNIISLKQSLVESVKVELQAILSSCFAKMDALTTVGSSLYQDIVNVDVRMIVDGAHQQPLHIYLSSLFNTGNASNHYALVQNNKAAFKDQMIDAIYDMAQHNLDRYQNLHVLSLMLDEAITTGIDETIAFWKQEYNIDGTQDNWKMILVNEVTRIINHQGLSSLLVMKEDYYKEELLNLLTLCKISSAIPVLQEIAKCVREGKIAMRSASNRELPTCHKVSELITMVTRTIKTENDDNNKTTLYRRMNDIKVSLNNNHNFTALYQKDSLEQDLNELEVYYRSNCQANPFDYSAITQQMSLYRYLEMTNQSKLFCDCIMTSTTYVNNQISLLKDVSILSLIQGLKSTPNNKQWQDIKTCITKDAIDIRKEIPGLIKIVDTLSFENNMRLPLIYAYADINALSEHVKYNMLDPDCSCELSGLTDAIIIYQEYGYHGHGIAPFDIVKNPYINKTLASQIRENVDYVKTSTPNDNDKAFYFKRRVPYLTKEQFEKYIEK